MYNQTIFLSMVYAYNFKGQRKHLWEEFYDWNIKICGSSWVITGDFNALIDYKDRQGGDKVHHTELQDFRGCMDLCSLEEVHSSGSYYTSSNKQEGEDGIYTKIDRVLINEAGLDEFRLSKYHVDTKGVSDTCPLIITLTVVATKKKETFKFFNMWV